MFAYKNAALKACPPLRSPMNSPSFRLSPEASPHLSDIISLGFIKARKSMRSLIYSEIVYFLSMHKYISNKIKYFIVLTVFTNYDKYKAKYNSILIDKFHIFI